MTNEQALANLYNASKLAPLTAEQHEILRQSAVVLKEFISKEVKVETKNDITDGGGTN